MRTVNARHFQICVACFFLRKNAVFCVSATPEKVSIMTTTTTTKTNAIQAPLQPRFKHQALHRHNIASKRFAVACCYMLLLQDIISEDFSCKRTVNSNPFFVYTNVQSRNHGRQMTAVSEQLTGFPLYKYRQARGYRIR